MHTLSTPSTVMFFLEISGLVPFRCNDPSFFFEIPNLGDPAQNMIDALFPTVGYYINVVLSVNLL